MMQTANKLRMLGVMGGDDPPNLDFLCNFMHMQIYLPGSTEVCSTEFKLRKASASW